MHIYTAQYFTCVVVNLCRVKLLSLYYRLDQPNLFRKNRHMELWYKPDFKFRFPTALLYFYFITPLSLKSPRE